MRHLVILLVFMCTFLSADTVSFKAGWNFIGFNNTINFSTDTTFSDNTKVKMVWKYVNDPKQPVQGWHIYTSDTTLKTKAENLGLYYSDILNYYEGAWVYALKDFTYTVASKNHTVTNDNIPYDLGWSLVSAVDNSNISLSNKIFTNSKASWVYRNSQWLVKNNGISNLSYTTLSTINPYEAFWVYNDTKAPATYLTAIVNQGTNSSTDTLITNQCSNNGGVAVYYGLDIDSSGVLEYSEYSDITPAIVCNGLGQSAYQIWLDEGNVGTETDFINSLKGTDGNDGTDGATIINPEISFEGATLRGTVSASSGLGKKLYGYVGYNNRSLKLVPKAASSMSKLKPYTTKIRENKHELLSHTFDVAVNSDGTYEVDNIPSGGDYSLVYVDSTNNIGSKIDDISIKPGEIKTVNVISAQILGSVKLKVQSLSSNTNLSSAKVVISELEKEVLTDSLGVATITNIPDGTYSLRIDKSGYVSKYVKFTVNFSKTTDLQTLFLNSQKGALTGSVKIDGIDVPQNVIVYAKAPDGSMFATLTDTAGKYTFNALAVTEGYSVITTAHGYANGKVDNLNIINGGTTTASELILNKLNSIASGSLRGYARFSDVANMNHAGIIVSIEGTDYEAITSRDGSFVINNIPAGVYNINFTESRYKTLTNSNVRVVAGAATSLFETTMTPNIGILKGKVVDNKNNILSGATVSIVSDLNTYNVTTDSNGIFNVNVVSGKYMVTAMKTGYGIKQFNNIEVGYSNTNDTLYISPMELVSNTIVGTIDVDGLTNNYTGVSVQLTNLADSSVSNAVLQSDGSFILSAVKQGNYKLVVSKSGSDYKTVTLELYNIDEDGYIFATPILLEKKPIVKDYDLISFHYIKGQNILSTAVRYNLNLPTIMPNGSTVSWSSDNTALVSNAGVVTLPKSDQTDTLNLTATVSYSGETSKTITIPITVIKDYQPVFINSNVAISAYEDFGYLFKSVTAKNANSEGIVYSMTNIENSNLLDAISIDSNSGEISIKSKENKNGTVTFDIVATSGAIPLSATQTITLTIVPIADMIIANTGEDKTVTPNTVVTLSSSASIDIDSDASYSWTLIKPNGSSATLSSPTALNPTFTPDISGEYILELTISNSLYSSTDSVSVYATSDISIADVIVEEGVNAILNIALSHPLGKDINISYVSNSVTAKQEIDYKPISGVLTIAANTTSGTLSVPIYGDTTPEGEETLKVTISSSEKLVNFLKDNSTITIKQSNFNVSQLNGINGLVITGQDQSGNFGTSIAGGDINNDGFDDLLIGANYAKDSDGDTTGVAYVIYSSDDLTTQTQVSVSNIGSSWNSLSGAKIYPAGETSGNFGVSVDIVKNNYENAYNKNTLLIGSSTLNNSGAVVRLYPIEDATFASINNTLDINNSGSWSFDTLTAENSNDYFGKSSISAGDINGDGVEDILISAPYFDNINSYNDGRVYLIFGTSGTNTPHTNIPLTGESQGIMITGNQYDTIGEHMSPLGDVNGDGYDDFIIGVPSSDDGNITDVGKAYLYFGREYFNSVSNNLSDANMTFRGMEKYENMGRSVSALGDINGDGYSDFAIGTPWNQSGEMYIVLGKNSFSSSSIDLSSTTFNDGFIITAESINSGFGESVSGLGDINGDGYDDFAIASPYKGEFGRVYVIYGNSTFSSNSNFNVADLNGINGFTIDGDESYSSFGKVVRGVGDINGDGYKDFAIGAPYASLWSMHGVGKTYLIYGGDFTNNVTSSGTVKISNIDGTLSDDVIIGSKNDDIITTNGGADIVNGGNGDDDIYVDDFSFVKVDGGNGKDSLRLVGKNKIVDLNDLNSNSLISIETIDISGDGKNEIILSGETIDRLINDVTTIWSSSYKYITIEGDSDDIVTLQGSPWYLDLSIDNGYYNYINWNDKAVVQIAKTLPRISTFSIDWEQEIYEVGTSANIIVKRDEAFVESSIDYTISAPIDTQMYPASTYPPAVAGTHYSGSLTGTVTFYPGEMVKAIPITLVKDDAFEQDYYLQVSLSNPVHAVLNEGDGQAAGGESSGLIKIVDNYIPFDKIEQPDGYTIEGNKDDETIGGAAVAYGDFNCDGLADIAVSKGGDGGAQDMGSESAVYIHFGSINFDDSKVKTDQYNNQNVVKITGTLYIGEWGDYESDELGNTLSAVNFNGDSCSDLVIGTEYYEANSVNSKAYVLIGNDTLDDSYDLTLSANTITFEGNNTNKFGYKAASIGDINNDGIDDVGITSDDGTTQKLHIIYGSSTEYISGQVYSIDTLTSSSKSFYYDSVSIAYSDKIGKIGDINYDGIDDFYFSNAVDGRVYVIFGKTTAYSSVDISTLDASDGLYFEADTTLYSFGSSVSKLGDINGDGIDDFGIIYSKYEYQYASIFYGSSNIATNLSYPSNNTEANHTFTFNHTNHYLYNGKIAGLGDINNDGYDDISFSMPQFSGYELGSPIYNIGRVYIILGNSNISVNNIGTLDQYNSNYTSDIDGTNGFYIEGSSENDQVGYTLGGYDINGDDKSDIIIGAPYRDPAGKSNSGEVRVLYGK